MIGGIYEIVCAANGKRYIGSAARFRDRWATHRCDLNKNRHHSQILQRAWNKHGANAFSFRAIIICGTAMLLEFEQKCLDAFVPEYNVSRVAGSPLGVKHSAETRAKVSAAMKGRTFKPSTIALLKERATGRQHTATARLKMSASQRLRARPTMRTRGTVSLCHRLRATRARAASTSSSSKCGRRVCRPTRAR